MLNKNIHDEEWLYKAVKKDKPTLWSEKYNRPTSALFKDSKGVSVDRMGERNESQVVSDFDERFNLRAVIKLTAKQCRDIGTYIRYTPKEDNIYHSEIHDSENKVILSSSKPNKLNSEAIENGIIYP